MSNIQLAHNLKTLRKRFKLTQTDMSSMLNISRQAYSNYETGKRTPDLDTLLYLSRFYRITLNELVLGLSDASGDRIADDRVPYLYSENKESGNSIYLSEEELDFLIRFRSLSKENRQLIAGFLRSASDQTD